MADDKAASASMYCEKWEVGGTEGGTITIRIEARGFTWISGDLEQTVEWRDVIRCHKGGVSEGAPEHVQDEGEVVAAAFTVHYVEKNRDNVWKHRWKTFTSNSEDVHKIIKFIQDSSNSGPERVLVIINPVAGSGNGKSRYHHIVEPLFKLAQIHSDVIESKDKHSIEQIGKEYDFSTVSGVVIVGGDGSFQQLIHTWLPRIQREARINIQSHDLKPLPCPIGLIPTGTENGLASTMYGCHDITTAALHIISGRTTWRHLIGVTSCGSHLGFSGILLANGSWCDMMDGRMEHRWLGPLRTPFGALGVLFKKRREFDIKLDYLPFLKIRDSHTDEVSAPQLEWESVEGRYTGVQSIPGVFTRDQTGKVHADVNAHGMTLILEKQSSRFKYASWMYKMKRLSDDMFDADFVTVKPVKAYKLKIVPKKEVIPEEDEEWKLKRQKEIVKEHRCRIDGELVELKNTEVEVRMLSDLMEMYGTGCLSFS